MEYIKNENGVIQIKLIEMLENAITENPAQDPAKTIYLIFDTINNELVNIIDEYLSTHYIKNSKKLIRTSIYFGIEIGGLINYYSWIH